MKEFRRQNFLSPKFGWKIVDRKNENKKTWLK